MILNEYNDNANEPTSILPALVWPEMSSPAQFLASA